ncbi:MAG: radical SAM protein [Salinivirgaceae bacterium]|nr:radical SAM protein [Salinivirgaceae bacterium]
MLLITPPFTQLNTPYPATAYLKGFLNTIQRPSVQADLGIELLLEIFSKTGLTKIFDQIEELDLELSDNGFRIFTNREHYLRSIDPVIRFLQNKDQTLALNICTGNYLPQAERFNHETDLEWAFGIMGTHDKARYLATLYLEDLGDLIIETIDPHFGFNRYAERIARTATHFDELFLTLNEPNTLIINMLELLLKKQVELANPTVVCITIPFPGNVYGALKCAQYLKTNHPQIKIILGGGYANTELRSVSDPRVFQFADFITLDDGEAPLQNILEYLDGKREKSTLKRTFCSENGNVTYWNDSTQPDIPQSQVGTPDYSNLQLDKYLSVIEVVNPMHRLWSDGRWNKLTLAHGCYWAKCTFCDTSLDYIKRYESVSASVLCDRIEAIIAQTGEHGFHFVDEAAPPALMRDLAIEILRRKLTVVWWTNVRFEKSFTNDLCKLLRTSGCIAISGGLEVASDRLLKKMKKGVTVAQVAKVTNAFTEAGIMVHAYLMYGFPTQTTQETIDSLEMVRQLFLNEVIQSGFWHQFAMTAHSQVGLHPADYDVEITGPKFGGFAENDLFHLDSKGANHEKFSEGLKHSIYNYMQGVGFDEPLQYWFDFNIPATTVLPNYIEKCIQVPDKTTFHDNNQILWLGGKPIEIIVTPVKKGRKSKEASINYAEIIICSSTEEYALFFEENIARLIVELMDRATFENSSKYCVHDLRTSFDEHKLSNFDQFIESEGFQMLRNRGLIFV